ncbi:collectin-12 [Plakobranchus ocellatus]|uniref:Collectin-12 n=1 Tax=Plakobranchus ocellatus TaxID=259542 RepID=A0AAV4BU69_9GAST|nr:collectin-12 [Plakobranchus ocellatus]
MIAKISIDFTGYVTYKESAVTKGRKYYVSRELESFNLAKMNERCKKDLGGYLFQLDQWREQSTITHFIFYAGRGPFFTGITDEKSEGKFYNYNDNTPAKDPGWRWFQPDNWWNEDCVEIGQFGLNDRKCGTRGKYICETHV